MGFVKILKNKAYSKRMQVKPKRRRQGKTDYFARRRLVLQDKNKYDSKKYRLVARRTNAKVIAQIIYSTMTGDRVLCAADSTELRTHGLTAGLTNYSSCYATGLLLARRLLKQVGLSDMYSTNTEINGEYFNVDDDVQDKRPFKALLDVGIARTTTGARVFGVLKGACDGGVNVPHNTKRFPGYSRAQVRAVVNKRGRKTEESEKVEANFNATNHRNRIMGNHVTVYMNALKKENADKFKLQFSQWDKCLTANKVKTVEDMYKKVHAAIIADPSRRGTGSRKEGTRKVIAAKPALVQQDSKGRKWLASFRLTTAQRNQKVQDKFSVAMAALNQ